MNPVSPVDLAEVRRTNARLVLAHLLEHGPASRSEIAERTGLSRSSLTNLINLLLARRVVREGAVTYSGSAGRPRRQVEVDAHGAALASVQVDGEQIRVLVTGLSGDRICEARELTGDTAPQVVRDRAVTLVSRCLPPDRGLGGLAVTVSGPVVGYPEVVALSTDLGWEAPVDLLTLFSQSLPGVPLALEKNANAAALAEFHHVEGATSLILLHADPGVGSGIVLDGRVLRSPDGVGSEVGHIPVSREEIVPCGCGIPGCLSSVASPAAMLVRSGVRPDGQLRGHLHALTRQALDGPSPQRAAVLDCVPHIARAVNAARAVIGPSPVVLGGLWRDLSPVLAPALAGMVRTIGPAPEPQVQQARLGEDAVLRGGVLLAQEAALRDPLALPHGGAATSQ
ncbi:ROK family transcriptional regulator [Actinomyces sp.]|uniref:ROK family transcriptional regulator n=1 Tax=Actinomyces sp. TaxID=29317 RepID=UPI0026DBABDB|nr:ROK family transcriptional regulator [Actinomyces sp.]MDO4901635.1 ROK family transcriptional regulator [Actinomyces sp.]